MSEHRDMQNIATMAPEAAAAAAHASNAEAVPEKSINREALIREAAYFRAQRRAFVAGGELEDWIAAEREIDGSL